MPVCRSVTSFGSAVSSFAGRSQISRRFVVVHIDEDEIVQRAAADAEEEARVFFLVDQPVLALGPAELMVEQAGRPVVGIDARIVKAIRLGIPDAAAGRIADCFGSVLQCFEVTDPAA